MYCWCRQSLWKQKGEKTHQQKNKQPKQKTGKVQNKDMYKETSTKEEVFTVELEAKIRKEICHLYELCEYSRGTSVV